jgi:hypothetical protein
LCVSCALCVTAPRPFQPSCGRPSEPPCERERERGWTRRGRADGRGGDPQRDRASQGQRGPGLRFVARKITPGPGSAVVGSRRR